MSKYWNKKINGITPYTAGEQPKPGQKVIKLNTNENPYPPTPLAGDVLKEFNLDTLRLYPDTSASAFREAVAEVEGVKPEMVFAGNGSDEVLALCFQTFFEKSSFTDLPVLTPDFSYSFYPVFEEFYDIRSKKIPLREDFRLEKEDYVNVPCCGITIANPNAPTSRAISLEDIDYICKSNPDVVVIIDEAYVDFEEDYKTAVSLLPDNPNLCVVKTLSKGYSLAGLRMGYALASEELIEGLLRARDCFNSYPTDRIAQAVATAAVKDRDYHRACIDKVIAARKFTVDCLREMGFDIPNPSANFIFAKPPAGTRARDLYQNLRSKGILVRYFDTEGINDRLRISIGTKEEMEELVKAIKEEIGDGKNS